MQERIEHSANCRKWADIMLALVVGLLGAACIARLYALAELVIPVLYVDVLLCLFFGATLGAIPPAVMRWRGHAGRWLSMPIVLLCSGAGYYFAWVHWICLLTKTKTGEPYAFVSLMQDPARVWQVAGSLMQSGSWSVGLIQQRPVAGSWLLFVWCLEAAGIFVMAWMTAHAFETAGLELSGVASSPAVPE